MSQDMHEKRCALSGVFEDIPKEDDPVQRDKSLGRPFWGTTETAH